MSLTAALKRHRAAVPALDLIEEAVGLLRQTPFASHLAYYIGAVPFWLGLLFFTSDMSQNAYAAQRLADGSLGMALLYIWNKCWQAVHAARMRAVLTGRPDAPWTRARILRMIGAQATIQPWGLIIRPIALLITLPFVWVSNFYQNITILGDGTETEPSLTARAWAQSKLWIFQAHSAVTALYLFTGFVWMNVCIVLTLVPTLLKGFFAVETVFSRGTSFYFNSTFFAASVALTSLAVDPLRKSIYAIRCFRGAALDSGEDLSAELSRIRVRPALAAVVAAALLLTTIPVSRAETPLERPNTADAAELDRRVSDVLSRREFAWRAPREKDELTAEVGPVQGWLNSLRETVGRWRKAAYDQIIRFKNWVRSWFTTPTISTPRPSGSFDWLGLGKALLVILGGALVVLIGWLCIRLWRERRPRAVKEAAAIFTPDLRSEDVVADQLPEDGWLALAREHASRGDLTLALRAAWLAGLAHLGHRELIVISRHKTNRDYDRELRRRARDRAPLLSAFDQNLMTFERSWYGNHRVTMERFNDFEGNLDQIRQS
jgi:Domain of unknown function (DUF4129)